MVGTSCAPESFARFGVDFLFLRSRARFKKSVVLVRGFIHLPMSFTMLLEPLCQISMFFTVSPDLSLSFPTWPPGAASPVGPAGRLVGRPAPIGGTGA